MTELEVQPTDMIRAAGAVVWRGDESNPEVALVHRPRYDDWSFPKGKLKAGEHVIAGAIREVCEETGITPLLGRALPPIHYLKNGRLKRVDYWAARAVPGPGFEVSDEVDEVVWLPVDEARRRLTYEWDAGLLRGLREVPLDTTPLIFVRHALAGSRQDWKGDDDERPLEDAGYVQAAALAVTLAAYRPARLISSPSKRCMQTLKPYALRSGLPIAKDRLLTETGYDHARALELALSVLDEGRPAVICSHGKVLDDLIAAVCERRYHSPSLSRTMDAHLRKGAFAVLHHAGGRVITAERYIV
ncbi:8-oxo-dGTP diphosphatase [Thermocatellispora tengchongensis]|uniref:8-oxo-dGTP diphosphatase n=1 Tax=Thermocatellispora tengchongensis TaxID=1073253 RepID=A0A840PAC3_9ACTN|nr:NUDIX hydrolase [Thermocatellispora tengchongensis]MBB5134147.1 8-oxo-dGTP diphosphatase [Thermocatellispora tengchongensis]